MIVKSHEVSAQACESVYDLKRLRSDGILTQAELSDCKENNISVSYDPLQGGWVPSHVVDDLHPNEIANVDGCNFRQISKDNVLNLRLRPWEHDDLSRFRTLLDDPVMWKNMTEEYPNPLSLDVASALLELSNTSEHHQVRAVLLDELPVGQVRLSFNHELKDSSVAEISYWIGWEHWGQGIGSAAVRMFVGQVQEMGGEPSSLFAKVKRHNAASCRVLKRAEFLLEDNDETSEWLVFRRSLV